MYCSIIANSNYGSAIDAVVGVTVAVSITGDGARTAIGAATGTVVKLSDAELLRGIGAVDGADGCKSIGAVIGTTVLISDAELFRSIGGLVGTSGSGCTGADDVT
jgi:hypothetical protein